MVRCHSSSFDTAISAWTFCRLRRPISPRWLDGCNLSCLVLQSPLPKTHLMMLLLTMQRAQTLHLLPNNARVHGPGSIDISCCSCQCTSSTLSQNTLKGVHTPCCGALGLQETCWYCTTIYHISRDTCPKVSHWTGTGSSLPVPPMCLCQPSKATDSSPFPCKPRTALQ